MNLPALGDPEFVPAQASQEWVRWRRRLRVGGRALRSNVTAGFAPDGFPGYSFRIGILANVAAEQDGLAGGFGNKTFGLFRIPLFGEIGNGNICSVSCESEGNRAADAAVGTRDECVATFEATRAFIARLSMVDLRTHFLLTSWRRLLLIRIGWLFVKFPRIFGLVFTGKLVSETRCFLVEV